MDPAGSQTADPTDRAQEPLWVFFFGDSICFGQGVSIHKGWVPRVSSMLAEFGAERGQPIEVNNVSVNGNTTRLALERMPYDVQSHEPELVLVQFGMNDCNYWETDRGNPRVSLGAFRANLREIHQRAFSFSAKRVIQLTNHPSGRSHDSIPFTQITYQQSNERYNEAIREVARDARPEVTLVDVEGAWNEAVLSGDPLLEELLLPDELHLSEQGHDLYYETVAPVMRAAVSDVLEGREAVPVAPGSRSVP